MSRTTLAIGLSIVALVAIAAIWFSSASRAPGPTESRPAQLAPLPGEVGDRVTALVLAQLGACQGQAAPPACTRNMSMQFRIVLRGGKGRVEALSFDSRGLAPVVDSCLRDSLERFRFEGPPEQGQLDVSFPVLCDGQGRLRLLSPAPAGAAGTRVLHSPATRAADDDPAQDQ